jgi:hypothetical protein
LPDGIRANLDERQSTRVGVCSGHVRSPVANGCRIVSPVATLVRVDSGRVDIEVRRSRLPVGSVRHSQGQGVGDIIGDKNILVARQDSLAEGYDLADLVHSLNCSGTVHAVGLAIKRLDRLAIQTTVQSTSLGNVSAESILTDNH